MGRKCIGSEQLEKLLELATDTILTVKTSRPANDNRLSTNAIVNLLIDFFFISADRLQVIEVCL